MTRRWRIAFAILLLCGAGLLSFVTFVTGETMTRLPKSGAEAAEAAAARYEITFAGLLLPDPLGGTPQPFPKLTAKDFTLIETTEEAWRFSYEPLAGPAIFANVSRQNGWVEFDSVVVSAE